MAGLVHTRNLWLKNKKTSYVAKAFGEEETWTKTTEKPAEKTLKQS